MLAASSIYIALGALLLITLTLRVILRRKSKLVGIGDGGDAELARRIRAHANAVETLPIGLLLLAALELNGSPTALIHGLGIALLLGRALHAWGLSGSAGQSFGRLYGMLLTLTVLLVAPLLLLWQTLA
ncbi:MAG: MAPEG family protein [Lysobacteraceae bacterium]